MSDNTSLVDALGTRYFDDWLRGAWFEHNNNIHKVQHLTTDGMHVATVCLSVDDNYTRFKNAAIPKEEIKSFANFSWPKLGYRNIESNGVKGVLWLQGSRSVHRGLREELVIGTVPESCAAIGAPESDVWRALASVQKMKIVFRPEFLSLSKGIKELLEGERFGFAMNEDVAVVVSTSGMNSQYDVLFRNKHIGNMDSDGIITVNNRVINKKSFSNRFAV